MGKYYYKLYGLTIVSDYALKNVMQIKMLEHVDVEIKMEILPTSILQESQSEVIRGYGWVYHFEKKWGFARFVKYGTFLITEGKKISYQLKSSFNEFFVSEIIVCLCLQVILMQRGIISLHGSCIERNRKGIIISGESGAGKSTLTTELLESGSRFLSDDIVPLSAGQEVIAYSSYPQRKLCEDVINRKKIDRGSISIFEEEHEKIKFAINQSKSFRVDPIKIDRMYILKKEDCNNIKFREIRGSDKLKYVIDSIFGKTYYDTMGFGMEQMKQAIKITETIRIYVITRPINKDTTKQIVDIFERSLTEDFSMVNNELYHHV